MLLKETEYIVVQYSMDNWQLLTCGVYFNRELRKDKQ